MQKKKKNYKKTWKFTTNANLNKKVENCKLKKLLKNLKVYIKMNENYKVW